MLHKLIFSNNSRGWKKTELNCKLISSNVKHSKNWIRIPAPQLHGYVSNVKWVNMYQSRKGTFIFQMSPDSHEMYLHSV